MAILQAMYTYTHTYARVRMHAGVIHSFGEAVEESTVPDVILLASCSSLLGGWELVVWDDEQRAREGRGNGRVSFSLFLTPQLSMGTSTLQS